MSHSSLALRRLVPGILCLLPLLVARQVRGNPSGVTFTQSASQIEAYDLIEVTAEIARPDASNPFTDATLSGTFSRADGTDKREVSGFCDSDDGGVFRPETMPIPLSIGRVHSRPPSRGFFTPPTGAATAPFASIQSIPGISSGRAPASITFSTAQRPTFCSDGRTRISSGILSTDCTA
jgi:hypothetical protein